MNQKQLMEPLPDIIENIKRERKHQQIQLPVFMPGQEVLFIILYFKDLDTEED